MITEKELLKKYQYVISGFRNKFAVVKHDKKMFHVNDKGEPAYKQRYKEVTLVRNDHSIATSESGEQFHINLTGEPMYYNRYDNCQYFRNGMAAVYRDDIEFLIKPDGHILCQRKVPITEQPTKKTWK